MKSKKDESTGMTLREAFKEGARIRSEEEMTRPHVEIWDVEDDWARWVSSHRQDKNLLYCHSELRASPFCPIGYH
jgi:hypothetical protein